MTIDIDQTDDDEMPRVRGIGLRERLVQECKASDRTFDALTVMGKRHDPYRFDTPKGHEVGRWFRDYMNRRPNPYETVHLRGFHYILATIEAVKPDGDIYRNNDKDYKWLSDEAADCGRWLGYVDHNRIVDERNADPEYFIREGDDAVLPYSDGFFLGAELQQGANLDLAMVDLPSLEEAMPGMACPKSLPRQPYQLVLIGEKVSLRPVLQPIAKQFEADLILPSGDLSDTLFFTMAERAAADGRPLRIFYFSDFDPSGWNMPSAIARKLQAIIDIRYPDLQAEVHKVGLTYEQCIEHDLPSTPFKDSDDPDTKKRAEIWRRRWGREQTEIDALAALQPEVLRDIAREAIQPFYDETLAERYATAFADWQEEAEQVLLDHPGYAAAEATTQAELEKLEAAFAGLERANEQLELLQQRIAAQFEQDLDLPEPPETPEPLLHPNPPEPLFTTDDEWLVATEKLNANRREAKVKIDPNRPRPKRKAGR